MNEELIKGFLFRTIRPIFRYHVCTILKARISIYKKKEKLRPIKNVFAQ